MFLCLALALYEILAREFQNNKPNFKQNLNETKLFKLQSRSQSATASTDRTRHSRKYHFSSPDLGKKGNICFRQRIRYKRPPKFLSSRKTKLLPAIPLRPASPDANRYSLYEFNTTYASATDTYNSLSARCGAVIKSTDGNRKPVYSFDQRRRTTRCSTTSVQ